MSAFIPDEVAGRILRLQQRARDSEYKLETAMRQLVQAVERRDHAIHRSLISTAPADQQRLKEEAKQATAETEALEKSIAELRRVVQSDNRLAKQASTWLESLSPSDVVEVIETRTVRVEDLPEELNRTRAQLIKLDGKIADVREAAKAKSEIKKDILSWLEQHKARTRPTWKLGEGLTFPSLSKYTLTPAGMTLAILSYIVPEKVDEFVNHLVVAMPDNKLTLTKDERNMRLTALREEWDRAERTYAALVCQAQDHGLTAYHLQSASVEQVLGIKVGTASAVAKAQRPHKVTGRGAATLPAPTSA